MAKDMKSQ